MEIPKICSLIQIIVILLFWTNFNEARSQCTSSDWVCDNGQCIQDDKLCDGKVDCLDRSDEIAENCIQLHETCPNYNFRCAYGACIDGKAKCNDVQDCADNSDELICTEKNDSDFQGACSDSEIQCLNSKECINSINLCDGQVHCKDGSDESLELCINFDCISFGFQCGYGACISGNAKCNGTQECADGSDEAWQLCSTPRKKNNLIDLTPSPRPKRTATSTKCNIPNIPQLQDMIFKLHPQNETIPLGSFVEDYESIHMQCQDKYTLRGEPSLLCQNGRWNFEFPSCVGYCDGSLLRGVSLRAVCNDGTHFVECPKKIRPGTEIQINCGFGYTRTPNNPQFIKCLPDGNFDKNPVPCEHNCGRVASNLVALSKNGIPVVSSLTPWHVTIHEKDGADNNYICSGSIVSPRIVITARSQCTSSDWVCDNGQCIQDDKLCDGKVDCLDRSDEIAENCIQLHETCPNYNFRCAYGACIDGKAKCNDVQDCADNSDELICTEKNDSDFQGACSDSEIQCLNSKECINSINLCDGQVHCKDGSDESLELCINFDCISFGFQCGYGACISGNAKCNGTQECADGSDEAWQLCSTPRKKNNLIDLTPSPRPKRTATSTKCNIPNIPQLQDMIFKLHPQNETIPLGSFVEDYESIHMQCQDKYTLRGEPSLLCQNGRWNFEFPSCVGYCDGSLLRGVSLRAVCNDGTHFVECPKKIRPGTEIQINCGFGYTRTPNNPQFIKCLPDGNFDKNPVPCEHNCGRVASNLVALSKNGIPVVSSLTPWHVTIHEKDGADNNYICSGSIVSPRIVITAAHCFWDEANLILKSNTEYEIIAGRSASNYTAIENNNSQTIQIEEIHIPTEYRGKSGRQKQDIAFVKLKTPLRYTETIAPICLPNEIHNMASNYVVSNQNGFLAGFGEKNQLERIKMITLSYHDCSQKSPPYAPLTDDKFCIYNNVGASVCRGVSGAGFFTENKNLENNEIIYRLLGVISNTPTTRSDCSRLDDEAYVAITNIHYMASDLNSKLLKSIQEDRALF